MYLDDGTMTLADITVGKVCKNSVAVFLYQGRILRGSEFRRLSSNSKGGDCVAAAYQAQASWCGVEENGHPPAEHLPSFTGACFIQMFLPSRESTDEVQYSTPSFQGPNLIIAFLV